MRELKILKNLTFFMALAMTGAFVGIRIWETSGIWMVLWLAVGWWLGYLGLLVVEAWRMRKMVAEARGQWRRRAEEMAEDSLRAGELSRERRRERFGWGGGEGRDER